MVVEPHVLVRCICAQVIEPQLAHSTPAGQRQVATECLASLGPQIGSFFQASTFLQFERDGSGAISLPLYVQYLSQHANAMQLVSRCFLRGGV
jgi:hypothetical protein